MAQGRFGSGPVRGGGASPVIIIMGFFFLAFAGLGTFLIYVSLNNGAANQRVVKVNEPAVAMVDVLIPLRPIKVGVPLEPALFRTESRPEVGLSSKTVRSFAQIQGKYARSEIMADTPLHIDFISDHKPSNGLANKIPPGFRAVTIRVDATSSVEGFAKPGSKVDVVWITTQGGEKQATVIVGNAKVLSSERSTQAQTDNSVGTVPSTVTLLVNVDDATKIQLAQSSGRLTLILRGDDDIDVGGVGGTITKKQIGSGGEVERLKKVMKTGVVRIKKPNGEYTELVLDERNNLVPMSTLEE